MVRPIGLHILGQKPTNVEPAPLEGSTTGLMSATNLGAYSRDRPCRLTDSFPLAKNYCHMLTQSWAIGLPVLASDIGTLRQRRPSARRRLVIAGG